METLRFKCTLLSEVILNQKAATEGPNTTLDFIPGNNFLGIAASTLYQKYGMCEKTMELFHSGKVRFGDAHPTTEWSKKRGLKVPACMYYPKLGKASEKCYISHLIPNPDDNAIKEEQIKQCRSGFYDFSSKKAIRINTATSFAIKSAYDRHTRKSKDEMMYGYQSLQKDLTLYFEVELESSTYKEDITTALVGKKRVGRSRTAQYGLVQIDSVQEDFNIPSTSNTQKVLIDGNEEMIYTVYADGRIIILDEFGLPTFQPTAQQLGFEEGEVIWSKSQIRTFQYSPWNYARQCFDTERCGIEKGSVFVVKANTCPNQSQYIGSYQNEGFGKVIYNPDFLTADSRGLASYNLFETSGTETSKINVSDLRGTDLLDFIGQKKEEQECVQSIYKEVNTWVDKNKLKFKAEAYASQWGKIRSIAMTTKTKISLYEALFKEGTGYLVHGVAAEKWSQGGRLNVLKEFVNSLDDSNAQLAIINLAAEMAKETKR